MSKRFTLGRDERLKSRKAIEQLFRDGNRFTLAPFRVFFQLSKEQPQKKVDAPGALRGSMLQFGVAVSTRNFKKAVDRNRIKRICREAWRLQKNELKNTLKARGHFMQLFLIYTGRELPTYEVVSGKVSLILKKLLKQLNENNSPDS
ncbi:MAG TPA: ribonuclease P protein component [Chitinophagaceae bacterium]|nr:ribonuclease P protein component [Chitinophagaceae bacterium]